MSSVSCQGSILELERAIECQIIQRTWGRISRLKVEIQDDRVVIHGRTSTYYSKQLALEAALESLGSADSAKVELRIEVGNASHFAPEPKLANPYELFGQLRYR